MQAVKDITRRRGSLTPQLARKGSITDKYKLGRVLGIGSFSIVKEAVNKLTGEKFACKIINHSEDSAGGAVAGTKSLLDDVELEISLHASLLHGNILRLVEYYRTEKKIFVVMELLTGGELLGALNDRGSFPESDARELFAQLLHACAYIHSRGIVHRDIKLENLLLVREGDLSCVKLADFGLSAQIRRRTGDGSAGLNTVCGTPTYVAPEVLLSTSENPYGPACDLWSAGVLLFNLLAGYPPFHEANLPQLFKSIRKGLKPYEFMADPSWTMVSAEAKDLIQRLLVVNPKERLSAAEALKHPWICGEQLPAAA